MRKISFMVLAAAFTFSVTGCGEEPKKTTPAKTDAKGDAKGGEAKK
jgi:type IV pilus biogenesis protein CpaD/CtpE